MHTNPPPMWLMAESPVVSGYKIVKGLPGDVEQEVNALIAYGWQPHGPLHTYASTISPQTLFAQAMIKIFSTEEGGMIV